MFVCSAVEGMLLLQCVFGRCGGKGRMTNEQSVCGQHLPPYHSGFGGVIGGVGQCLHTVFVHGNLINGSVMMPPQWSGQRFTSSIAGISQAAFLQFRTGEVG